MATQRKSISKRIRFDVFKRDGFACTYCGAHPPAVVLHVDHVLALAEGGGNEIDNLVTACAPCNLGKGARNLKVVPQTLAEKAALVAEQDEQLRGYQQVMEEKRQRIDEEVWRVADALQPGSPTNGMRRDWLQSIRMFVGKLGVHEVLDAADQAYHRGLHSDRRTFLYFCSICWARVKEGGNAS
ncbi:MAG: HNH endonuclease [Burkholderiales bacterium]|nr:HNH endonuclease [Burkholderiales bacterium]